MAYKRFDRPIVKVPLMVLSAEASKLLLAHMGITVDPESGEHADDGKKKAKGKLTIQIKAVRKAKASNVVAVLQGKNKKLEAVVISAHHDHVGTRIDGDRFNGADDNASGTSALLEIAEAFARCKERPARSIVFLSVSGEELGLWGSAYYADHPTWPKDRITANINIDMIGRAGRRDEKILMQITPSHEHQKYSSIVKNAVTTGAQFGIEFTSGDTYYRRSDHYNFAKLGIPVVFFCDGEHPDYHQVTDHADKLDYAAMEAITRLAYWTAWQTADAKGKPKELGRQSDW
jgi:Zn-dependent M28 family amino/carboxypeptidase